MTFDLEPGVRALVAHLAAAGHTMIAYLEGSTPSATFTVRRELLSWSPPRTACGSSTTAPGPG